MKSNLLAVFLFVVYSATAQTSDTSLTKNNNVPVNTDSVYTKVDVETQFPGGNKAWQSYIYGKISKNIKGLVEDPNSNGICTAKFIVDKDGSIISVEPVNMKNSELARVFVRALLKGPKWIPAEINGIKVKSIRLQKVNFKSASTIRQ